MQTYQHNRVKKEEVEEPDPSKEITRFLLKHLKDKYKENALRIRLQKEYYVSNKQRPSK